MDVLLKKIKLPEDMMRQAVSETGLKSLSDSIKAIGFINPLIVRKTAEDYELVAGLRRYMAADMAGIEKVPIKVAKKGKQIIEKIKIDENYLREPINPIDEGIYFEGLINRLKLTQKALAKLSGLSESYISQRIGSQKWPNHLKEVVKDELITFSVAREFSFVDNIGEMNRMITQAINNGCSPAMAARWRKEANRDLIQRGSGKLTGMAYICHVCGDSIDEKKIKTITACPKCQIIIKQGQEQGIFKRI